MTDRRCGGCTACCTALAVAEIDKPVGVRCPSLVQGRGCGIYQTRPDSCSTYRCLWLDDKGTGTFRTRDRPDRIGVLFDQQVHPKHGPTVIAREARVGGLNDPRVREVVRQLARAFLVLGQSRTAQDRHVSFDCVLGGPPAVLERFLQDAILMGARTQDATDR